MTGEGQEAAFSDPLLRSAAADALADAAPHALLRSENVDLDAITQQHWALAAQMGWTGMLVEEARGGLGLDLAHVADICEEMGRHLFCGPFIETAILLPSLASAAGGELREILPGIVSGDVRVAFASADPGKISRRGGLLLAPVEHVLAATHLVALGDAGGDGLYVAVAEMDRAAVEVLQPLDLTAPVGRVEIGRAAFHHLDRKAAQLVARPVHIAVAADLFGIGEALLERTVAHVGARRQFGAVIGSFQAIKHRLADSHVELVGARLAIAHAAADPGNFTAAVIARVAAAEAALRAAANAIQFHGGLGFSWEADLHFYLKRARRLAARNGGSAHLRTLAGEAYIEDTLRQAAV